MHKCSLCASSQRTCDCNVNPVVVHLNEYSRNKKLKELLRKINPLLVKKEKNIRIHLEALINNLITEDEFRTLDAKMELAKLCLDLEEKIPDGYVTMTFYCKKENHIYHGAAPSFPLDFFDFYKVINENNLFNANFGTCGPAIFNKKVAIGEITTNFSVIQDYYDNLGFRTVWSVPFFDGEQVLGTFAMFHRYKKVVTEEEIQLAINKMVEYQSPIRHLAERLTASKI